MSRLSYWQQTGPTSPMNVRTPGSRNTPVARTDAFFGLETVNNHNNVEGENTYPNAEGGERYRSRDSHQTTTNAFSRRPTVQTDDGSYGWKCFTTI